jgi:glutamate-1-semialdehyde aminotransferase
MPWMTRWPGSFPLHVQRAHGARFVDVDDIEYVDFCLGDTGAMTGHALEAVSDAVTRQARLGLTTMLPTSDAQWVAENLAQRFGVPKWQFSISATDANRFVLRFARMLTGRPKVVVHDWCYHGTVDETLVILDVHGKTISRPGAIGPQVDPGLTQSTARSRLLASAQQNKLTMVGSATQNNSTLPNYENYTSLQGGGNYVAYLDAVPIDAGNLDFINYTTGQGDIDLE